MGQGRSRGADISGDLVSVYAKSRWNQVGQKAQRRGALGLAPSVWEIEKIA